MTEGDWAKLEEINERLSPMLNEAVGVYNLGLTIYTNDKICHMAMGYKRICQDGCSKAGFIDRMRAFYLAHKEDIDAADKLLHPHHGPDWFEAHIKKAEGNG